MGEVNLLRFLWGASRRTVVLSVLVGLLSGASSAGTVAVISMALKGGASPGTILFWSFIGLAVLMLISSVFSAILLVLLGQDTVYELRMRLSRQILATPLRQLEELGSHRLLASLTDDVNSVTQAVTLSPLLFVDLAVVLGCFAFIGWLSWEVLLVILGFAVLGMFTYQLPSNAANRHLRAARDAEDALYDHFRALTLGTKELKLHQGRQEAFLTDVLAKTAQTFRRYNVQGMMIYTAVGFWGQTLFIILIGLLIFVVPRILAISPDTTTGFTLAILYMITPFASVLNIIPSVARAIIALDKVQRLGLALAAAPIAEEGQPEGWDGDWSRLTLRNVVHTYTREGSSEMFSLGPLDLMFNRGEVIFIVGGNGSGKTTLAKVLTGLYVPESGSIWLDGREVTDENRHRYRQLFSTVFSDFYLFDRLLGISGEDFERRAADYLSRLELAHKVTIENGTFSTTSLSTGQRKRLALLTAYVEDRPLYLFDEWASDQDPAFKEIFYSELLPELRHRGRTVFVITHDDHYFNMADRLIKLDYGRVEFDTALPRERAGEGKGVVRGVGAVDGTQWVPESPEEASSGAAGEGRAWEVEGEWRLTESQVAAQGGEDDVADERRDEGAQRTPESREVVQRGGDGEGEDRNVERMQWTSEAQEGS